MNRKRGRWFSVLLGIVFCVSLVIGVTACGGASDGTEYKVHFETNCSSKAADKTYVKGEPFNLPTPYNFGYTLNGWYYDAELTDPVSAANNVVQELNVKKYADKNRELTLYAGWKVGEYKIIFETDTQESFADLTIKVGETVDLPVPQNQTKGTGSYPFDYWYYAAAGTSHKGSFTLSYPEDVYLTAKYDYGVLPSFRVDEEGRYYLSSSARCATTVSGLEMAYGTLEADVTFENFSATGAGLIWNADLGTQSAPWEKEVSYYYFHMNPSSGALQLAHVSGSYVGLKTVALTANKTGYAEKFAAAKAGTGSGVFHVKIESSAEGINVYIDDELQISVLSTAEKFVSLGATGVGFRTTAAGTYFSNLKVTPTAYQVAFDANGGSSEPAYLRAAINGETGKATVNAADLPVPVRPGYEFLGWTDEDGKVFESAEIDCSILLTAKWDKLPNGALVSFDGEGERKTTVVYKPNGAALGELPEATKLGFTFLGWYYTDGGEEIRATEQSVFAEENYNGDTKEITLYPKWARETGVNSTDVTLKLEKGRYTEEADYDGYVAYTAGVSSFTTFDGITLDEGRFSAYVKFPTSGSNGIILGATIADDFGTNCDANYMFAGSSYYYWHFNAASGVWQFAKVTNAGNEESQNASSRGYDVLASGTVAGYVPGGRYLLTVETYNVPQGKRFDLYLNGTLVQSASDTENVGGAALTGTALGFRNAGGGATYYGIEILPVAQMENVVTLTLSDGESTQEYVRAAGWETNLPVMSKTGYVFVGWTREEGKADTMFADSVVTEEMDGWTLYAYYLTETQALIYFDPAGGTYDKAFAVVEKGVLETDFGAASGRPGYVFDGWYDENGVKVCAGYEVTETVSVHAEYLSAVADAGEIVFSINDKVTSENDGIYDLYTISDATIGKFDKTLESGTLSLYVQYNSTSGKGGILFGATGLENLNSSAMTNASANYYYWYVNAASGGWILYKVVNGSSTNLNDQVKGTGTAWKAGTFSKNTVYRFNVTMEKGADGSLTITLSVTAGDTDYAYITYTDTAPHTGTQIGYLNNTNGTSSSFYGLGVLSVEEMQKETLTLNAGAGATENGATQITVPMGWKFTLPGATRTDYTFLGWATEEGGDAAYQPGGYVMSADFAGKTLYAVYTNKAVVTFVTSIGTAPENAVVTFGSALTAEQLAAPTEKAGYVFEGWYDENQTKVTTEYVVSQSLTLMAKYSATVPDAGDIVFSINNKVTSENDGVYNVYTISDASVGKFDKTLESGTLSLYVSYGSSSGVGGILFGATALETLTSSAQKDNASANYYYWYVNPANGRWMLYKYVSGVSTVLMQPSDWKAGTYSIDTIYRYNVAMQKGADGSLTITLSVTAGETDYVFSTCTDTTPHTGTQIGFLNNANGKTAVFYGLDVLAVEDMSKETVTLDAGEGETENGATEITVPMGWKFTLPAATRSGFTFLGWATEEGGNATYSAGAYTMSADFAGKTLYAVYANAVSEAVVSYETSLGTAPESLSVTIGSKLSEEQLAAPAEKAGYVFDGWYDENQTKVTTDYEISQSLTLTAKYSAAVADAGTAITAFTGDGKRGVTSENDGVYNVYTISDASVGKFDKTLEEGTFSLYVQYYGDNGSGRCGIVFGATALETLTTSAASANSDFYYWYVNATSTGKGAWILYKYTGTTKTNLNTQYSISTAWKAGTFSFDTVYRYNVTLTKGDDGSLTITLSVTVGDTDYTFATFTDASPKTGTQIGFLNEANNTSTSFYGLSVTPSNQTVNAATAVTLFVDDKKYE